MREKSRENLMQMGDRSAKFFYSIVKINNSRNHIKHLINEKGESVTDINGIREEAPSFFEKLFKLLECVSRANSEEEANTCCLSMA